MTPQTPKQRFPRLHRNGTVSYWSYFSQEWVERSFFVPAEEIEAMDPYDQRRVRRHLGEEVGPEPAAPVDRPAPAERVAEEEPSS